MYFFRLIIINIKRISLFQDENYLDTSLEIITKDFENFYLPVEEVATALDLALTINEQTNTISGWYINEQNSVNINLSSRTYVIAKNQGIFETDALIEHDDIIYISQSTLNKLMSITAEIRANVLKINFTSELPLPRQAKLERQKARKLFELRKGKKTDAKQIEDRYHWLLVPNIDVSSQLNWHDKNNERSNSRQLSIQGAADFALHQGAFSLNENSGQYNARLSLSKQININDRPWHYELGDIKGFGRGFAFSGGNSLERQFGNRRFEGNAQPGWEVELYRNDSLVDYQEVGQDGRYLFESVPVQIGDNHFKLVLYGPQGERKEIEEYVVGHQLTQKANQWTPSFSISEPNKRLLPLDHNKIEGTKIKAALGYGINDNLETNLAWQQYKGRDQFDARLTGVWESVIFNLNSIYRLQNNQLDIHSQFNTKLFDHDWGFGYSKITNNEGQKQDSWAIDVAGNKSLLSQQDMYGLSFSFKQDAWDISANHSANFSGLNLNNRLTISKDQEQKTVTTNTGISFRYKQHRFRFEADYSFLPEKQLDTFAASYSRKFEHTYLQLKANLRANEQTTDYSAHLSWQFDYYRLGAKFTIDEHDNKRFGLTFSMAFGAMPINTHYSSSSLRNTATIKAQAFLDVNNNGIFDINEQPVAGIGFKGNQKWQNKVTDESGIIYLPEARTVRGQYVEFKKETLDDPFLTVDETRYNVFTHPGGLNELYFPIYETCEVEGEIVLKKGDEQQAKAAVPLLLIDQNGKQIQRILSEYDGFFIFTNVKPGQYRIEVEQDYLKRKGYSFNQSVPVDTEALDEEESLLEIGTLEIVQE